MCLRDKERETICAQPTGETSDRFFFRGFFHVLAYGYIHAYVHETICLVNESDYLPTYLRLPPLYR